MAKLPSLQSLPQARRELRTAELPTGFLADSPVPAVCLLGGFGGEPPALRPAAELGARQAKPPSRGCDSSPHAVASVEVLTAAWTFSATSSESQTASRLRVVSVTGTLPLRSRFSELIERLKRAEVQAVQSVKLQLRRESVVSSAPPWLWQLGGWREVGDSKLPGLGGRPRQSPSLSLSLSRSLSRQLFRPYKETLRSEEQTSDAERKLLVERSRLPASPWALRVRRRLEVATISAREE